MSKLCKSCGSKELEMNDGCLVCTECGVINSSQNDFADDPVQQLTTNDKLFSKQTVHSSIHNKLPTTTPARKFGIKLAETIAANYNFTGDMKKNLMLIYKKSMNHKTFFNCSKKEILAGVCSYVTMMNYDMPIAIEYICDAIGCDGYEFGRIYNLFINAFPQHKPQAKPIEELVPQIISDNHFDKEEINQLEKRVIDIICLERVCWLVEGRSPILLINAASYLAWKSIKPNDRFKVGFTEFCQLIGMQYVKTISERVKELTAAMIKLANQMPSVKYSSIKINKKNVVFYIDYIVKYPNSLIYDLKNDIKNGLDQSFSFENVEMANDNETISWMESFKQPNLDRKRKHSVDSNDVSLESEKGNDDDEDPEISDTEIESYLRLDKEVKMILKLRKKAKLL